MNNKMNKYDLAHRFFHNPEMRESYVNISVSFKGDKFYSYSTVIGQKVIGRDGREWLLISDTNFSNTTSKHLSTLMQACPHNRIVYVPQKIGGYSLNSDGLIKNVEYCAKQSLTRKDNRLALGQAVCMLERYNEHIADIDMSVLGQFSVEIQAAKDMETDRKSAVRKISKAQAERAEQARIKREKEYETVLRLVKKHGLMILAKFVWEDRSILKVKDDMILPIKSYLLGLFESSNDSPSYVWISGMMIKTSQYINMYLDDVKRGLELWKRGQLLGSKVGRYKCVASSAEFVKIGCHKIPIQNVQELYDELISNEKSCKTLNNLNE